MNNPILLIKDAGHGETPPCPDAIFRRGDVVKVRDTPRLASFPREAVVAVAIPPDFSSDWALADLLGEPRPLMIYDPGASDVRYILVNEGDRRPYIAREKDLTPTGKSVEIGSIRREGAVA
jgi:hypothetical protein